MAQILNRHSSIGGELGDISGKSLSSSIESILQHKAQEMEARKFSDAAEQAGLPKEAANFLKYLSPQERLAFFQRLQPGDFGQQDQQQDQSMSQLLQSPQMQQQQGNPLSQLLQSSQAPQQQLEKINPMISPQQQLLQDVAALQQGRQQPTRQQQIDSQNAEQPVSTQQSPTGNPTRKLVDILSRPSPSQQASENRLDKKLSHAEKLSNRKDTKKFRETISQEARDAREEEKVLKRGIAIVEGGKNRSATINELLKRFDIDLQSIKNGDTTELEKLARWHMRGARSIFGGKVSNYELQSLLASVPNELQGEEGYKALANRMLTSVEGKLLRFNTMQDIIKENGGEPPYDLDARVQERIEPQERELADKFIKGESVFTTKSAHYKLPSASEFKGKIARDTETGQRYRSDGSKWTKV